MSFPAADMHAEEVALLAAAGTQGASLPRRRAPGLLQSGRAAATLVAIVLAAAVLAMAATGRLFPRGVAEGPGAAESGLRVTVELAEDGGIPAEGPGAAEECTDHDAEISEAAAAIGHDIESCADAAKYCQDPKYGAVLQRLCCATCSEGSGEQPVTPSLSEPYDCSAGYSNWEAGWSDDKKTWCCANKHIGCPPSEPYDCQAGYSNWEAGWSEDKKAWCCQNKQMGCPVSEPFDCQAGYSNWQAGWSADKKEWCCANKKMGCSAEPGTLPATTSPSANTLPATTAGPAGGPSPAPGTKCLCTVGAPDGAYQSGDNGVYGTCAKGQVGCCSSRGIKCDGGAAAPSPTLAISTGGAGAGALPVPTIASPVPSIDLPMGASPSASPVVGGSPAPGTKCTCTVGAPDGAYKAGDNGVYGNCIKGEVGCCSSSAVKCDGGGSMTPPTLTLSTSGASADTLPASTSGASANTLPASTSEPYDCQAGYSNWEAGWSEDKKAWCCESKQMGCPPSEPFDCQAGYSNWEAGWSEDKKAWCCDVKKMGCAASGGGD